MYGGRRAIGHPFGGVFTGPAGSQLRQADGTGCAGSTGSPDATASRWVQVRGTTRTSSYPPPPVSSHRPPAISCASSCSMSWARALPVDAELQVGQRVEPVAVAAVLADQHLRPERAQQRRHDRVERAQPARVAGARGQRHVDRVSAPVCPTGLAGSPVPGNSVAGCSCRLIVSTRGSS